MCERVWGTVDIDVETRRTSPLTAFDFPTKLAPPRRSVNLRVNVSWTNTGHWWTCCRVTSSESSFWTRIFFHVKGS